ncbi:uncharacterized protein LOC124150926 [Haliotis rufescens]|uniref:uncharacterized protein LOC124150926 n=1 Tax=Haliotis rufescens TaxID=6454 RepID=UPI00201EF723|nr:uncharacterized protein LOC124150926 [Haliotis rufescens]
MGDKPHCQVAGYLSVHLKGVLWSKSWQRRYCVLVEPSGKAPQIHVFEKVEHFQKKKEGKVICLDQARELKYSRKRKLGFDVVTKKDKYSFTAETDDDFKHWVFSLKRDLKVAIIADADSADVSDDDESDSQFYMDDNIIYESADTTPMFNVTIEETEASERCRLKGQYVLAVNFQNLALVDCNTKKALFQWPFKYIRRFGKTRNNFQFEAGRKCISGEGEFSLKTDQGILIFETVTKATQMIRTHGDDNVLSSSGKSQHDHSQGSRLSHGKAHGQGAGPVEAKVSPKMEPRSVSVDPEKRSSVRSGGNVTGMADGFASQLNQVIQHKKEGEHLVPNPRRGSNSSSERLSEDVQPAKKLDKKELKAKKEQELKAKKEQAKREEQEQKARKEQEQKAKKEQKEQELKNKKKKDKKGDSKKGDGEKKPVQATLSASTPRYEEANLHAYEDITDITSSNISQPGPEPLYAEAAETTSLRPIPKPKPRTADPKKHAQETPDTVVYSEPQKKKDAWKQHARPEDNVHQEDYDNIKVAATSSPGNLANGSPSFVTQDDDDTYDRIVHVSAKSHIAAASENIYGMASGRTIAELQKERAENEYEETMVNTSAKKNVSLPGAYEEPSSISPSLALPSRQCPEGDEEEEEEEDAYAAID